MQRLYVFEEGADAPRAVTLKEVLGGKKAVLFGLPGEGPCALLGHTQCLAWRVGRAWWGQGVPCCSRVTLSCSICFHSAAFRRHACTATHTAPHAADRPQRSRLVQLSHAESVPRDLPAACRRVHERLLHQARARVRGQAPAARGPGAASCPLVAQGGLGAPPRHSANGHWFSGDLQHKQIDAALRCSALTAPCCLLRAWRSSHARV
jgi:hypothetical protein